MDEIAAILAEQDGVISRRQALAAGMASAAVRRALRRREWVQVHPGVYVDHTGRLSWRQSAWAAVLACEPAALAGRSALRAFEGPGRRGGDGHIEVLIAHERRVAAPAGVRLTRSRHFDDLVQLNLAPPRVRYEAAIISVADAEPRDLDAIAVLADACGGRRTTAARLLVGLSGAPRLHRREWLTGIIEDVAQGTCSVLEHGYLVMVERPHGLPRGERQTRGDGDGRAMFRDVLYQGRRPAWRQIVELDGRLFNDSTLARDGDLERDLDAALEREPTARLGYGQVFDRPCSTAAKMERLLQLRGWHGEATRCPRCPPGDDRGAS